MNDAAVVELNPFRNAPIAAAPQQDAMVAINSSREVAEVQTAMLVARRFPRDQVQAMDNILQACTRPTLAQGALYEYARGGTDIRGPSIRLAECLAQYWGHIDFGWRVIEERPGVTKIQTFAWDLQTGVRSQLVFDVEHLRVTRTEKKQLHDPRDIYEHIANAASRRLRRCILSTIPGDVVEAAVKQCETTLKIKTEVTPERLSDMLAKFGDLGVTKAQLEKRIQRRLEAMTPGLLLQLGKIYNSITDGMSSPGDWFDQGAGDAPAASQEGAGAAPAAPATPNPRQAVRDRLQAQKRARTTTAAGDPAEGLPVAAEPPVVDAVNPSPALQDIIRFARAAADQDDIERVRQIALQLETEDEALVAQSHINAAIVRIAA